MSGFHHCASPQEIYKPFWSSAFTERLNFPSWNWIHCRLWGKRVETDGSVRDAAVVLISVCVKRIFVFKSTGRLNMLVLLMGWSLVTSHVSHWPTLSGHKINVWAFKVNKKTLTSVHTTDKTCNTKHLSWCTAINQLGKFFYCSSVMSCLNPKNKVFVFWSLRACGGLKEGQIKQAWSWETLSVV